MLFPAVQDPLGEALHFLRMSGTFYCRSELTAPWGVEMPVLPGCLIFHVITSGRAWLDVRGAEKKLLQPGELALVPHGEGHRMASEPRARMAKLFDLPRELISERYEILRYGGGGAPTTMICGAVELDHPAARQLIQLLPKLICLDGSEMEWLHNTLRFMVAEARELRPGGEAVLTRLADIVVIQAIRSWIERDAAARTGWLGALKDRQIGPALLSIQHEPARDWTVASLAARAAMSRSAFAARFTALVGEPPMQYLARWRMQVAVTALKEERASIAELAGRLGYQSEAAFSRAFKRFIGVSPGAVRRAPASNPLEAAGRDR
jgi:AraC-like DNA-binding protein